jgi:chemotaxis protein MotB
MKRALIVLVALVAGCVSSGTHEALQKEHATTLDALREKEAQNAAQRASLEKEQQHSQELADRIARLESELASAQQQREKLEAEKSAIVSDKSKLQASVEEMKRALADLARRKAEADARLAEFKSLINRFRSLIDAGKLRVKIADGRMVVELASDVLFASGSSMLSKDGQASIKEVAGVLASIPERKFQVEGHTDNVPIKSPQYPSNWELAAARAITVSKTMVDAGMPPERISAASFGEFKPARPNDAAEGRAANRRIEIVVVPDLSSLPGFDELNRVAGQ